MMMIFLFSWQVSKKGLNFGGTALFFCIGKKIHCTFFLQTTASACEICTPVHLYIPLFKAFGPCARLFGSCSELLFFSSCSELLVLSFAIALGPFFCVSMRASIYGASSSTVSSLAMAAVLGFAPFGPFFGAGASDDEDSASVWVPLSSFFLAAAELLVDPGRQVTRKNTAERQSAKLKTKWLQFQVGRVSFCTLASVVILGHTCTSAKKRPCKLEQQFSNRLVWLCYTCLGPVPGRNEKGHYIGKCLLLKHAEIIKQQPCPEASHAIALAVPWLGAPLCKALPGLPVLPLDVLSLAVASWLPSATAVATAAIPAVFSLPHALTFFLQLLLLLLSSHDSVEP